MQGPLRGPPLPVCLSAGPAHALLCISLKSQAERRVRNDGGRGGERWRWGNTTLATSLMCKSERCTAPQVSVCGGGRELA